MSSQSEQAQEGTQTLYIYSIPLHKVDGVEKPVYGTSGFDSKEFVRHTSNACVVGTTTVAPHFHKDSMSVKVEKVEVSSRADILRARSEAS